MHKPLLIILFFGILAASQIVYGQSKDLTDLTISGTLYTPYGALAADGEVCVQEDRQSNRTALGNRCIRTGVDGSFLLKLHKLKNDIFNLTTSVSTDDNDDGLVEIPSLKIINEAEDVNLKETETKLNLKASIVQRVTTNDYQKVITISEIKKYETTIEICRLDVPLDCERRANLFAGGQREYKFFTPDAGFVLKIRKTWGEVWCEWRAVAENNHSVKTLHVQSGGMDNPVSVTMTK